ncbi:hypothetical protein BC332_10674 [Capsicum chinense]|nr:hypothetical protein BC332_10674 [Capsicum chinense]
MNDVVNSDDDFQDMPLISLSQKGKSKMDVSISPSKKIQKQKQMSSGASISIKTPTKVVSNAAASNTSPLLINKTIKKSTLNKKPVKEKIQSPHIIEQPVTNAAVKRTIPIHDINILNQKDDALESYVKSEFQNLRNLINTNNNIVMDAIKSKDIVEKSNMDVNGTPSYLNVPIVREHDANINVQLEKAIDEVPNMKSTLKVHNAGIYIEKLTDDLKNMVDETNVDCEEGDLSYIDLQHDFQIVASSIHMENPIEIEHSKSIQDETQTQCMVLDCGVFIVAYAEYIRYEKGIPPRYFDAKDFRTRYAALLWQHGTQKNEIGTVTTEASILV